MCKFSIIMPTYNRAFCIKNAINSLLEQTFKNWELIIVDDGSDDNTFELLKNNYEEFFKSGKFVYKKIQHSGVCNSRNIGLSVANNEWIAYLDSDNVMLPNFLETYADAILQNPKTNCFYSKIIAQDQIIGKPFKYKDLCKKNFIDLGVFVHKKLLTNKYGNFDTNLERLVDWDLIIRYTKRNKPVFINQVLLKYNTSNDIKRITNSVEYETAYRILKKKIEKQNFSLMKNIFSMQNEYFQDIKYKIITVLGIKFKFEVKNNK